MLTRLLGLRDGEFGRLLPFFGLYALLFAAFALADGVTLALFVKHTGSAGLPRAYAIVAIANFAIIGLYVGVAERFASGAVFRLILLASIVVFGGAWVSLHIWQLAAPWYDVLFVAREIAFTLLLMHFGTYLQDYFTRDEMSRILPLVYSGGRVGGILGGALLQFLPDFVGVLNLLGVFLAMCALGIAALAWLDRTRQFGPTSDDAAQAAATPAEEEARRSYLGFLRYVWHSPLLTWLTVSTTLFIMCRWILNFQYSSSFESSFESEEDLAEFLGLYTQLALAAAILVQVLLVHRLIRWWGLAGAHLAYSVLMLVAMIACIGEMTIALAGFARFVETELRLGLRNPINQLLINESPRSLRIRIRGWSFGVLIPLGTLASSLLLGSLPELDGIAWLGAGVTLGYVLWSLRLYRSLHKS